MQTQRYFIYRHRNRTSVRRVLFYITAIGAADCRIRPTRAVFPFSNHESDQSASQSTISALCVAAFPISTHHHHRINARPSRVNFGGGQRSRSSKVIVRPPLFPLRATTLRVPFWWYNIPRTEHTAAKYRQPMMFGALQIVSDIRLIDGRSSFPRHVYA